MFPHFGSDTHQTEMEKNISFEKIRKKNTQHYHKKVAESFLVEKKGTLEFFLDQFRDFILKRAPKIKNQMKLDVETILSYWN